MSPQKIVTLTCRDEGCGNQLISAETGITPDDLGMRRGWTFLTVAGGWRCPSCTKALLEASVLLGFAGETKDGLAIDDRGALKDLQHKPVAPTVVKP